MPEIDLKAATEFFKRAAKAPLLQHLGEPLDDSRIERVKNWDQAAGATKSHTWQTLMNRANNHFWGKVVESWGGLWYQAHYRKSWHAVNRKFPAAIRKSVTKAIEKGKLPADVEAKVCGFIGQIGLEYAFAEAAPLTFYRIYTEKWLLDGHLPCGWKGRLPAEPRNLGKCDLDEVVGDGRLIVF